MSTKDPYVTNKSFVAYNGETIWPGMTVCFTINTRTGSSTTRRIHAQGRVINTNSTRATISITSSEHESTVTPGNEVKVYHEDIIAPCVNPDGTNVNHRFIYHCDGGMIQIGNNTLTVGVFNNYGDGEHHVTICDNENFDKFFPNGRQWFYDNYECVGQVAGSHINVYNYDCHSNLADPNHILATINGTYNIYITKGTYDGDIAIIKQ